MLKRLYRTVYRLLMIRWNHIRYAKKIGVNMLGGGYISMELLDGEQNPGLLLLALMYI